MRSKKNKIIRSKKKSRKGGALASLASLTEIDQGEKLYKALSRDEFFKKCKIIVIVGHGSLLPEKLKSEKQKIIIPLNRKKKWVDPFKSGPESMEKYKLLKNEISVILEKGGEDEIILERVKGKLNEIMREKLMDIENEEKDERYGQLLMEKTGKNTVNNAIEIASNEIIEEVERELITQDSQVLVERELVNEHGSIINFTVYKEPKDMEILLLGKKGRVAQKKEKEQKYADINYILGYCVGDIGSTKEGEILTREIQTTYDTKIKLSKLLEVLNEGEQVERKKIIIPIICLEEKSNGIVTVLDKENTLFKGKFNENEDEPTTPRGVYKTGERVQAEDMLMGASPSPFKLTPDKYGEGSMVKKSMSSPPVWMRKNVSSLSRTSSDSSLGKRKSNKSSKSNNSNSSNNYRMRPKLKLNLRNLENN